MRLPLLGLGFALGPWRAHRTSPRATFPRTCMGLRDKSQEKESRRERQGGVGDRSDEAAGAGEIVRNQRKG